ncbi:hypothetical protein [Persicobacter diffluens]|uniref:Uncharacterized protein n=1 Tax=Persicobacter diffluens TaxID=981 RepID=A0AAN4W5L9_9BACT|nr:hypothetical protein PEDI_50870 [Persicobacter diffluens]GJM64707.1 hypothetical protein PEDI_52590 [Persicobacter diffluens]
MCFNANQQNIQFAYIGDGFKALTGIYRKYVALNDKNKVLALKGKSQPFTPRGGISEIREFLKTAQPDDYHFINYQFSCKYSLFSLQL